MSRKTTYFNSSKVLFVALCHMTSFACIPEPLSTLDSTSLSKALMNIMRRFGFAHISIVDADSKFCNVCDDMVSLLHINCYHPSKGNHHVMLLEQVLEFCTKH